MTFAVPKNDFLILEIIFFLWVLLSIFFSQFPFEYSFSLSIHWTVRISLITVHSFKKCSKLYNIICMNICNIYSKNNSKMNLPLVLLIYLKGVVRVRPLSHSPPTTIQQANFICVFTLPVFAGVGARTGQNQETEAPYWSPKRCTGAGSCSVFCLLRCISWSWIRNRAGRTRRVLQCGMWALQTVASSTAATVLTKCAL